MAHDAKVNSAPGTAFHSGDLTASSVLAQIPDAREWLLAFSGGLDSTVLLHLLANMERRPPLRAIHINHQLSASADAWQQHAESVCAALTVECTSVRVAISSKGRGLEDAARAARYTIFEKELATDGVLLLAHHQNDQAETLLLRLLRGAGVRGMAAMPKGRALGKGRLCRPLLNYSRETLSEYAARHSLSWVEDHSNSDTSFDRNYLRNDVLPLLASRWPSFANNWSHSAAAARDTLGLLSDLAQLDLADLDVRTEVYGLSLDLNALQLLSHARLRNVLSFVLEQENFEPMPRAQVTELINSLIPAAPDAAPLISWAGHQLRRFRGRLYVLYHLPELADSFEYRYQLDRQDQEQSIEITGVGELRLTTTHALASSGRSITVRFRRGGESVPCTKSVNKTLKNWLQEQAVPPWMRERLPLIFVGEQLAAVSDLWRDPALLENVEVDWGQNDVASTLLPRNSSK